MSDALQPSERTLSPKSVFLKLRKPYTHLEALLKQISGPISRVSDLEGLEGARQHVFLTSPQIG